MTKRTRFILFLFFLLVYLIVAPVLIFYALGYRLNFDTLNISTTGGIYLKIWPQEADVLVGEKIKKSTGIFSNELLIQGLSPKSYEISVLKDGYFSWKKTLEVKNQEVTRIDSITLIKENPLFEKLEHQGTGFYISQDKNHAAITSSDELKIVNLNSKELESQLEMQKPIGVVWSNDSRKILIKENNGYSLFDTQNKSKQPLDFQADSVVFNPSNSNELIFLKGGILYLKQGTAAPILNNVLSYSVFNNQIIWLSDSGLLRKSDLQGKNTIDLNETAFPIKNDAEYIIIANQRITLLKENSVLFYLDQKKLEKLSGPITNALFSPDNSKIVFFNDDEILLSDISKLPEVNILTVSLNKIDECFWLNNNYLIFRVGNDIKITETDSRDKLNIVTLPKKISVAAEQIELKKPEILWDSQIKKLYILDQGSIFESEKLNQ